MFEVPLPHGVVFGAWLRPDPCQIGRPQAVWQLPCKAVWLWQAGGL